MNKCIGRVKCFFTKCKSFDGQILEQHGHEITFLATCKVCGNTTIDKRSLTEVKKFTVNAPWVFWFYVIVRKHWFSYWWKTRSANSLELQVWIFRISIGMPWKTAFLASVLKQCRSLKTIFDINDQNLKSKYSILINRIK